MPRKRRRDAGLGVSRAKKTKPRVTPRINQPDEVEPVIIKRGPGRPKKIDKGFVEEDIPDLPPLTEIYESSDDEDWKVPEVNGKENIVEDTVAHNEHPEEDHEKTRKQSQQRDANQTRAAIAYLFTEKYGGLNRLNGDLMQNWKGKGGIISKIRQDLGYKRTSNIKIEKVLVQIVLCAREGRKFNPADLDGRTGNRSPLFDCDSIEANIIADNIEAGLSERNTLRILNQHLTSEGREPATRASIVSVIRRLKPKIVKVEKQKQGSSDEESLWARARYMQTR